MAETSGCSGRCGNAPSVFPLCYVRYLASIDRRGPCQRAAAGKLPGLRAGRVREPNVPWVDLGVVPQRTALTPALTTSQPVDLQSEARQVPPITAAHVAKGVTLGELCQAYYPAAAKRAGQQGSVVVLIFVAANGRVTDGKVECSSGVPRLDDAAIRCVTREGRFEPQRSGSAPVEQGASAAVDRGLPNSRTGSG